MKKLSCFIFSLLVASIPFHCCWGEETINPFEDNNVTVTISGNNEPVETVSRKIAEAKPIDKIKMTGIVRINLQYVRAAPWGAILGTVTENTIVNITGEKGDWYQIAYKGQTGYIHSKWIVVAGKPRNIPDNGTVISCGNIKLRPEYNVVEKYAAGTRVQILGQEGDYWRIKYQGYEAYVAKNEIQTDAVTDTSSYLSRLGNTTNIANTTNTTSTQQVEANNNYNDDNANDSKSDNYYKNNEPQVGKFDIANKTGLVSICYSTWFDPVINGYGNSKPLVIQDCLNGKSNWGPIGQFHYWGKPAIGFYKSTNRAVIKHHMKLLQQAGIDFIILDNTNVAMSWKNSDYWTNMVDNPGKVLLDTIVEMRNNGEKTPYVVNWIGGGTDCVNAIYEKFYTDSKYDECWVYWNKKPFILTTQTFKGIRKDITTRKMWGLQAKLATNEWCFLKYPNVPSYNSDGKAEQICVCVALQSNYMSNTGSAIGRRGGKTFNEEWKNAFKARPKVVTITWWNEWCAQRFEGNAFVDNYTMEYSRDIEPMSGGHGNKYYDWMCKYIAAYKNKKSCPTLVDE